MDISTVLPALLDNITKAIDLAKTIKEGDISGEEAEIQLRVADLLSALADAKLDIADIQQTLVAKDAEIDTLKEKLKVKVNVQWEKPYYWLTGSEKKDGPFCQHCFDESQKLTRLQGSGDGYWHCNVCQGTYVDSTAKSVRINPDSRYSDSGFRRRDS
jgi:hypothetical protein